MCVCVREHCGMMGGRGRGAHRPGSPKPVIKCKVLNQSYLIPFDSSHSMHINKKQVVCGGVCMICATNTKIH